MILLSIFQIEHLLLFLIIIVVAVLLGRGKMKKILGIIFLLIGLGCVGLGVAALTSASSRNNSYEGQIGNTLSQNYRTETQAEQSAGVGFAVGGIIVFLFGIYMVVSKSKSQVKQEVELEVIKNMQKAGDSKQAENNHQTQPGKMSPEDKFSQIERLGKLKEQGLLTDEEFQLEKNKILS